MIQAAGFEFRTGEKADLVDISGQLKMAAYGHEVRNRSGKDVTLTGTIQRVKQYPMAIHEQKPIQLDVSVSNGDESITKRSANSSLIICRSQPALKSRSRQRKKSWIEKWVLCKRNKEVQK